MRKPGPRLVAFGLVALGAAVAIAAMKFAFLRGPVPAGTNRNDRAPEFVDIAGWLNSPPLTLTDLRGRVVLVDFWAYSCINCVRTFPALRQLYARYEPFGLQIVGVHSPEFEFEKLEPNVREAIKRNDLTWPVALDNDMATWRAYRNNYWPHVYLIDATGRIRFDRIGEGGDEQIQAHIRSLLAEAGKGLPEPVDFTEPTLAPNMTPEIYAGSERGSIQGSLGNPEGFRQGIVDYKPVAPAVIAQAGTDGVFFLQGKWRATGEYLEAVGSDARLVLPFSARDVFFVASSPAATADVRLLLDGKPVPGSLLGADASGGVVRVGRSDLYRLLHLDAASEHQLTLEAAPGFRLYTFTFG